jgi:glyceraldehyde-3-phosphate dehydrogenase (NADP+)
MISIEPFSFIHGRFHSETGGDLLRVTNKYSGELLNEIHLAGDDALEASVLSVVAGYRAMQQINEAQLLDILGRLLQLLDTHSEHLAETICAEAGKPISYARQELLRCKETIKAGIREIGNPQGEMIHFQSHNKFAFTQRFSTGPILGITPFNFPLNLALHKIIPALAVKSAIVIKSPLQTPLSLLKLAVLIHEAGAPAGAVNVVVCNNAKAEKLVRDERFSLLSFTGSDRVGWYLKSIAGKKKVCLELGGNAPAIIDQSADVLDAAKKVTYGAFLYAGQICISTQKVFVSEENYSQFMECLLQETSTIQSGDPFDPHVVNGPMIDMAAVERTTQRIDEARRTGAEILFGGHLLQPEAGIFAPSILSQVNPEVSLSKDEAFAPVLIVEKVRNTEHAIKLANNSRFGLQCGVFCRDTEVFRNAFNQLQYGAVLLNSAPGFRVDHMPYGGIKDSGQGREGVRYAMHEFTEMKLAII